MASASDPSDSILVKLRGLELTLFGLAASIVGAAILSGVLLLVLACALAYPRLPPIDALTDYRPKLPMRVFTADGILIGEFGGERRTFVRISAVPPIMKEALLAAEDDRFYQHSGIDLIGIARALVTDLLHPDNRAEGGSTITQQVAKNFFLSSERSLTRKFYEGLLSFKIESALSKDQIFEAYINQIYLGQHAYGFAAAEETYFGKPLQSVTIAEAAMLAGLPKGPSTQNPVVAPARAKARQAYVLGRMVALGYITPAQYQQAKDEALPIQENGIQFAVHAEYVAEIAGSWPYPAVR